MTARAVAARVANLGLFVSGLALVVVLGTGGTRLQLPLHPIGLRRIAGPFTFCCLFGALRLLCGSRASGLEGRVVQFLARQGLPPRDAPATVGSSARAGALLGAGLGLVAAITDLVRVIAATPPPGPLPGEAIALAAIAWGTGILVGALAGALLGGFATAAARLRGAAPGRYEAGRRTAAALLVLLPLVVWLAPPLSEADDDPAVLLLVAASALPAALLAFLAVPAAVLRAQRGRWGVAVVIAVALALVLGSAAIVALAPPSLYASAHDVSHANVLVVSVSGLRTEAVGAYRPAAGVMTPTLSVFERTGAVFAEAQTPSTDLPAAAASLLTGLYPASHGLRGPRGRLRQGIEGLPAILAAHGYRTAAFVSTRRLGARETGLAPMFERYDDPSSLVDWLRRTALGSRVFHAGLRVVRPATETVDAFRDWIGALPGGAWFAWVQLADTQRPHPELVPPDLRVVGGFRLPDATRPLPDPPPWAAPEDAARPLRDWLFGYIRAARAADDRVRDVLAAVDSARGEKQRTIVVVVAEYGAPLGDEGRWFGAPLSLAEETSRVPWLVAGPGVRAGTRVEGPCSLVDVAPTLLGMLGIRPGRPTEGEDLSRYLSAAGGATRDPRSGPVFAERVSPQGQVTARAVRYGRFKMLRGAAGEESLYVVDEGTDRELPSPRGREERQKQQLSDMLTRRQSQEGL